LAPNLGCTKVGAAKITSARNGLASRPADPPEPRADSWRSGVGAGIEVTVTGPDGMRDSRNVNFESERLIFCKSQVRIVALFEVVDAIPSTHVTGQRDVSAIFERMTSISASVTIGERQGISRP